MQVHFRRTNKLEICGCSTTSYLLEKSRVTNIGKGERSYHIFYQLIAGADSRLKKKLQLEGFDDYSKFDYLNRGDLGTKRYSILIATFSLHYRGFESIGF